MTGRAYYAAAMQSHGLPGKIPTSFTTGNQGVHVYTDRYLIIALIVGKPYFENIQYNSPIEMYDDNTVDEMVKIMNNAGATAGKTETEGPSSNMGWSVKNVTTSNHVYKKDKVVSWSNM